MLTVAMYLAQCWEGLHVREGQESLQIPQNSSLGAVFLSDCCTSFCFLETSENCRVGLGELLLWRLGSHSEMESGYA